MKDFLLNLPKRSFPLLAFLFFVLLAIILDVYLQIWIKDNTPLSSPLGPISYSSYPLSKDIAPPDISAQSAIVMDDDSKVVLFAKNPEFRFSTASTAKIMTALVSLEAFNLNDFLTVKTATVEGSFIGLKEGEKVSFENLLYAILLPSANDAALAIAQNYPGGESALVDAMNKKAKALLLYSTHFADPAGLLDDQNYTTAFDLARLVSFALKDETFSKVVATKSKVIEDNKGNSFLLKNLNKLLGVNGVNGVKTGHTDEAGQVLVTSKIENGHTLIMVVMKSEDRFGDTEKVLQFVSGNIIYLPIRP